MSETAASPGCTAIIAPAGEEDGQRRLQDEDQAVAEEEAHGLQVDGRARHELAGLLAVEEAELELLQVLVHAVAQVELDAERHASRDQSPRDGQRQAQHARGEDDEPERRRAPPCRRRWIWSMARPVSHGMATVMTIATAASSPDKMTPLR